MAKHKHPALKKRLGRAGRMRRRAPVWVMVKTGGRIRGSIKRRSWRTQRIKP
jgi:ribosomal protein L39E